MGFPTDFLWGTASASAQVEGGWREGGKCPSIWDVAPGKKIKNGDTCHVACDHYHRYKEDVALMREMGLKSYRFSVSWCRVMPSEGKISSDGLAFYSDLIDELIKSGIEPLVTLYHWDLPVWVQEKGGWLSDKIAALFCDYVRAVVDALSDRVTWWIPLNEPQCFIMNGYMTGAHAPFKRRYLSLPKLTRNCLMANRQAVDVIRKYAKKPPKIGIAMAAGAFVPPSESEKDVAEARKNTFYHPSGLMSNRWWGDPLFKGEPVRAYGIYHISQEYARHIRCDMDFIGLNVYFPLAESWFQDTSAVPENRKTSMGWIIDGRCLYWTIRFFYERYGLPVIVTENGMADNDAVDTDGHIHDGKRIAFLKEYLGNLKRAVDEKIPVLGYQYWSILDNFEWAEGYGPRFGLVHVDYKTQKRTMKDSGIWYRELIAGNGAGLTSP